MQKYVNKLREKLLYYTKQFFLHLFANSEVVEDMEYNLLL